MKKERLLFIAMYVYLHDKFLIILNLLYLLISPGKFYQSLPKWQTRRSAPLAAERKLSGKGKMLIGFCV